MAKHALTVACLRVCFVLAGLGWVGCVGAGGGGGAAEIALLTDGVRAASVHAVTDVTCLVLDKASFTRLLGPCEDILKRNMANYNQYIQRA
jgi:hypothetical protein